MVQFEPTHLPLLLTNFLPRASAEDAALWKIVSWSSPSPCASWTTRHDNERKKDPLLKETLRREASGILAWLVHGCLAWQQGA